MNLFEPVDAAAINNERLAIILGLVTLASVIAAFLSCRTCVSWLNRLGLKKPLENRFYASFYRFHFYYWWAFGVLLVAHLMVAVIHTGLPQTGDPDAAIHWTILGLGLGGAAASLTLFSSCRVLPKLISMATPKSPLNNSIYKAFFRQHAYFWLLLAALAGAHFGMGYGHAGIWPTG